MFKELIQKMSERKKERKEKFREMDEDDRLAAIIEERKLSSNERELNRYLKEEREKQVKKNLDFVRKKRDHEVNFLHNPINAKNIIKDNKGLMKQKNLFNGKNMFAGEKSTLHGNNNLLKNGGLNLCR